MRGRPIAVLRGGSWNNKSQNARAAYRNQNRPDNLNNNYGLRLVLGLAGMIQCLRPVNPYESRSWEIGGRGHLMLNQCGLFPAEASARRTRGGGQPNTQKSASRNRW